MSSHIASGTADRWGVSEMVDGLEEGASLKEVNQ